MVSASIRPHFFRQSVNIPSESDSGKIRPSYWVSLQVHLVYPDDGAQIKTPCESMTDIQSWGIEVQREERHILMEEYP